MKDKLSSPGPSTTGTQTLKYLMNRLSTPELDNVYPGNGAVSTSDVRYSAWFYKDDGKGCAVISDKISKP
jgi:hypothetical protein